MKITDVYLQNQLMPNTKRVRSKEQTQAAEFHLPPASQKAKPQKQAAPVSFELSRESQRILSLGEKQTIAALFAGAEQAGKTYTPRGEVAKMITILGCKIDVKG